MNILCTLILSISLLATASEVCAYIQSDAITVHDSNGDLLGFVHTFEPDQNIPHRVEPLVFVPGFEIANLGHTVNSIPAQPGSFRKGRELYLQSVQLEGSTEGLLDYLVDTEGFVLYIIDFLHNDQSITKNSAILERFLSTANVGPRQSFRESATRGIVMGFSMGGIVAKHALAKLEHHNIDHHISLYVSLDAPHRGAYMPSSFEVTTRTLAHKLSGLGNSSLMPVDFAHMLQAGVANFDSTAAKELLGLYIGYRAADPRARHRLQEIGGDHHKAAHPLYYDLRYRMIFMGGYPENLRTVAVSHGNMVGYPLHANAQQRDGTQLLDLKSTYRSWLQPETDLLQAKFKDDSVSTARSGCYVRVFSDRTYCPPFRMPGALANVSSSPGSYIEAMTSLDRMIDEMPDLQNGAVDNLLNRIIALNPNLDGFSYLVGHFNSKIAFHASMTKGEGRTTFIPTISAFDINTQNWFASANAVKYFSPFDELIANQYHNYPHGRVSLEIKEQLVQELTSAERNRTRKRDNESAILASVL